MDDQLPDEAYFTEYQSRTWMLAGCLCAGSLSVYGILELSKRSSYGVDELVWLAISLATAYATLKVLRAMYTPELRLTKDAIIIRRIRGHRFYPFKEILSMATYGEVHSPTATNVSRPERPLVIDHLLMQFPNGVHRLKLPANHGEAILDSLESRIGFAPEELENRKQARQWSRATRTSAEN